VTALWPVARPVALFAAVWSYVRLFRSTFVDDAFISLKYSAMLASRGEWGFLPERASNTATSPLNVIVHAAVVRFTPSMVDAIVLLTAVELTLILALLLRLSRRLFGHAWFGWLAFVTLATNCLLVSTFGLEGVLFTLLFVWALDRFAAEDWTWLAVALAGVVLARPDGALFVFICAGALVWRRQLRWKHVGVFALMVAPWLLYSWIHLGSLVPDTLQIKLGQRGWGRNLTLFSGLGFYYKRYPLETIAAFSLAPFALAAWWTKNTAVKAVASLAALYALVHMAAYSVAKIPPYHWYYVNQVTPIAIVGAIGLTNLVTSHWQRAALSMRVVLGAVAAAPALGLVISMSHLGFPLKEAPIHTNWGTFEQYREVGEWIHAQIPAAVPVYENSEIGTVGFYADDRLIVNEFSDANRTYGAIVERYPTLPRLARLVIDLNYFWRSVQPELPEPGYALMHYVVPLPKDAKVDENVVMSWETSTRWIPHGRLYLFRRTVSGSGR